MKKKKIEQVSNEISPQQSLEKILRLEIEVAEKIASAKDEAEKKLFKAREHTTELRNQIINAARKNRDEMIQAEIERAHCEADEIVLTARQAVENFLYLGKQKESEAVRRVVNGILRFDLEQDQ